MKNLVKSTFRLDNHKIKRFSLHEPANNSNEISITFEPSGKFFQKEGRYILNFDFFASTEEDGKNFIEATVEGDFMFNEPMQLEDIPPYFYANSIAIIFPYLRAFVTTLTSVANIKPLILPTLNLSKLESVLKERTQLS